MKLLTVIHYPVFGGPHNQALRLNEPLLQRGWETIVLLPQDPGNAHQRLEVAGVRVITAPLHRLRATFNLSTQLRFIAGFWHDVQAIRSIIREHHIDVVQINGLVNPQGAIAARLEDVPVVWQLLDTRPPMVLRRLMMPVVMRLSDIIMSTGLEVARVHPGALRFGPRLIPYFPPVVTEAFRPDAMRRTAARAELGVSGDAILVGTIGNLNPQKGHEYLIRACALMQRWIPALSVRILGAHTPTHQVYEQFLRAEARALGFVEGDNIGFADPGARTAELLPAFDLFILASVPLSEGIPTVILEAMAAGIPVVATDVGAVREVVSDGVTGFVVPPLQPEKIAEAGQRILHDLGLHSHMGSEARRHAVERYDVSRCLDTHLRAYESALARRSHIVGAS